MLLPVKRQRTLGLPVDQTLHDITTVNINGDEGDDLGSQVGVQLAADELNECHETVIAHLDVLLHTVLLARLELVQRSLALFRPINQARCQHDLGRVVSQPLVSRLLDVPVDSSLNSVLQDERDRVLLHLGQVIQPVFHRAGNDKRLLELHNLTIRCKQQQHHHHQQHAPVTSCTILKRRNCRAARCTSPSLAIM